MVGRQLPFFSLIVPFWLLAAQVGWRGMVQVWPACLVCGGSFGLVQFAVSNFHGPWWWISSRRWFHRVCGGAAAMVETQGGSAGGGRRARAH